MTRRNLELVEPLRAGTRGCTLLETVDATVTPMGARLLRGWLLSPFAIRPLSTPGWTRLKWWCGMAVAVPGFGRPSTVFGTWSDCPGGRPAGRATPRELGALRDSFQRLPDVAGALTEPPGRRFPTEAKARRWPRRRTSSICSRT